MTSDESTRLLLRLMHEDDAREWERYGELNQDIMVIQNLMKEYNMKNPPRQIRLDFEGTIKAKVSIDKWGIVKGVTYQLIDQSLPLNPIKNHYYFTIPCQGVIMHAPKIYFKKGNI